MLIEPTCSDLSARSARGGLGPGIAIQVVMLAGLVLLLRVDWASLLESRGRRHDAQVGAVGAIQAAAERDEGHRAGEQREPEEDDAV